jgi:rod shape-determining protein MreB and related proteins
MLFRADLAMDLGTANTLIYRRGEGIVLNEPSVVLLDQRSQEVLAIGLDAREYLGRTPPNVLAVRPLRDGVIADFEVTQMMIGWFVRKAMRRNRLFKPMIVIGVPAGITQVEKRAVTDAALLVGAKRVRLIEEPMAAAIGAGLPVGDPQGSMIVDIGGGTTEVAVISMSSVVVAESIRIAGDEMDEAIQRHVQDNHHVLIGDITSEKVKIKIGAASPPDTPMTFEVYGKCLVDDIPMTVCLHDQEIREAIQKPVNAIVHAVLETLEKTPPGLARDISDKGMYLAGGGALLRGLDRLIARHTSLRVIMDNDPLTTVVRGAGMILDNQKQYAHTLIN